MLIPEKVLNSVVIDSLFIAWWFFLTSLACFKGTATFHKVNGTMKKKRPSSFSNLALTARRLKLKHNLKLETSSDVWVSWWSQKQLKPDSGKDKAG